MVIYAFYPSIDTFIVEIPRPNHNIANKVQHPFGNAKDKGLTLLQRKDWNKTRNNFQKERARQELLKRMINDQ